MEIHIIEKNKINTYSGQSQKYYFVLGQTTMRSQQNIVKLVKKISENRLYQTFWARGEFQDYIAFSFDVLTLYNFKMMEAIEYNEEVMREAHQFEFSEHFLQLHEVIIKEQNILMCFQAYEYNLDQFISKKGPLSESQALYIFDQVLKAIYSLVVAGYYHRNIRPQHFVLVGNVWKLKNVVFENYDLNHRLKNDLTADPNYQPPEATNEKIFTEEQLDDKVVWDLGCILIFLLSGKNVLSCKKIHEKFKYRSFTFVKVGIHDLEISQDITGLLGRMCHYIPEKRMKPLQVFSQKILSKKVAEKLKIYSEKNNIDVPNVTISTVFCPKIMMNQSTVLFSSIIKKNSYIVKKSQIENPQKIPEKKLEKKPENKTKKPYPKPITAKSQQQRKVIKLYREHIEKCKIFQLSDDKYQKLGSLFQQQQEKKEIIAFAELCIKITTNILLRQILNNQQFLAYALAREISRKTFRDFTYSQQYKKIQVEIKDFIQKCEERKEQLISKLEYMEFISPFVFIEYEVFEMLKEINYKTATFETIKRIHRQLFFSKIYRQLAASVQETQKKEQGELCLKLVFVVAIDKLFIPEDFQDNFASYKQWARSKGKEQVLTQELYQEYIKSLDIFSCAQESKHLITKYYNV